MKIYTIDNNGYITGVKDVLQHYIINPNDIEGVPQFEVGFHCETGLPRPKTEEQLKVEKIVELKQIIDNKNYLGDDVTAERAELRELLGL
jgi:hypothetical protein